MKRTLLIIVIGYIAGMAGAYTYFKIQPFEESEVHSPEIIDNTVTNPEIKPLPPENVIAINETDRAEISL